WTIEVFDRGDDGILNFGRDVVTDGDQVVGAHETLTGVREFAVRDAAADGFPIVPIHYDDRRFAAQLQSDGSQLLGGQLIHPPSNSFGACVKEVVQSLRRQLVQRPLAPGDRDNRARVQVFGQNSAQQFRR